jgi:multisubunit Na+/H+ antiporter MnhE subunit
LAVWVVAFGSAAPNVVVGGIVVAGAIALALRRMAPRWPEAFLHPVEAVRFAIFFMGQLARSTWDVVWSLRLPGRELHPAIVEVPLRVRTRNEVSLLMNAISFTPGTVALELHDHHLYVHVLHVRPTDDVLANIAALEDRIIAAFGSHQATSSD